MPRDRNQPEELDPKPAFDRCHTDGDLRLPAPAVRARRHHFLPPLWSQGPARHASVHRRGGVAARRGYTFLCALSGGGWERADDRPGGSSQWSSTSGNDKREEAAWREGHSAWRYQPEGTLDEPDAARTHSPLRRFKQ